MFLVLFYLMNLKILSLDVCRLNDWLKFLRLQNYVESIILRCEIGLIPKRKLCSECAKELKNVGFFILEFISSYKNNFYATRVEIICILVFLSIKNLEVNFCSFTNKKTL